MQSPILSLTLPGRLDFLPVAISFVRQTAQLFDFSDKEQNSIQLATEEALVYTIKSLSGDTTQDVRIECRHSPGRMEISIYDKGLPSLPETIPQYDPNGLIDAEAVDDSALSMFLLKHAMDEVHFHNLGREGKETLLIKNISAKRIDNLIDPQPVAPSPQPVRLGAWYLRSFRPEDALEISRCAYRAYGYSYESYIYYPERIAEMNACGTLRSWVAVDAQETLLGHIALKFCHPEDPIAEVGVMFVNPACRNKGIFRKIFSYASEQAAAIGLFGLYGRAVTSHTLSQKIVHEKGGACCALMLALFPNDVEFKELTGKTVQKESAIVSFESFAAPPRTIYAPRQHAGFIEEIFQNCKTPVTIADAHGGHRAAEGAPAGETQLSYSRMDVFNTADIFCFSAAPDMAGQILAAKRRLCLERTDVLYLFLDLEQPGCADLCGASEGMGFFFSGVLPFGLRGHHALILQYLNNLPIDFEKIHLYDPFAQRIAAYVKRCEQRR